MIFADIVSIVTVFWSPVDEELLPDDCVPDPVEAHVNGLGCFVFDAVVGEANPGGGVYLDGGGRLGMNHFGEGDKEWESLSGR